MLYMTGGKPEVAPRDYRANITIHSPTAGSTIVSLSHSARYLTLRRTGVLLDFHGVIHSFHIGEVNIDILAMAYSY